MTNCIIGYPRQNSKFTLSGGSWQAAYPVTNAHNDEYARVARSTNDSNSSTIITGTAANVVPIRICGIAAHNISLGGSFRLRFYDKTDSPSVLVYDSGVQDVWSAVYTYEGRIWDTFNFWTGQYTQEELQGQIPFRPILLNETVLADYFILEIFDDANPAGYIDIGLFEIASGWEFSVNPEYGAQYGYRQFTRSTEVDGGLRRYEVFAPSYVFEGSIPFMDRREVQNQAAELFRQYGISTPFIWMPEPDNQELWLRNSKMVNLVETGLFGYIVKDFDSVPLRLEEYKG